MVLRYRWISPVGCRLSVLREGRLVEGFASAAQALVAIGANWALVLESELYAVRFIKSIIIYCYDLTRESTVWGSWTPDTRRGPRFLPADKSSAGDLGPGQCLVWWALQKRRWLPSCYLMSMCSAAAMSLPVSFSAKTELDIDIFLLQLLQWRTEVQTWSQPPCRRQREYMRRGKMYRRNVFWHSYKVRELG
jgi:hypothetical protein